MSNLRRYEPGGRPVFLTFVTFQRQPILVDLVEQLRLALSCLYRLNIVVPAWVVVPDHFHAIIELKDNKLSDAVHRFKRKFGSLCYTQKRIQGRLWQHRFWDHIIRDYHDFSKHLDYIHYNPVKHGIVSSPFDWPYSSIHSPECGDQYTPDWGQIEREELSDYGE